MKSFASTLMREKDKPSEISGKFLLTETLNVQAFSRTAFPSKSIWFGFLNNISIISSGMPIADQQFTSCLIKTILCQVNEHIH